MFFFPFSVSCLWFVYTFCKYNIQNNTKILCDDLFISNWCIIVRLQMAVEGSDLQSPFAAVIHQFMVARLTAWAVLSPFQWMQFEMRTTSQVYGMMKSTDDGRWSAQLVSVAGGKLATLPRAAAVCMPLDPPFLHDRAADPHAYELANNSATSTLEMHGITKYHYRCRSS